MHCTALHCTALHCTACVQLQLHDDSCPSRLPAFVRISRCFRSSRRVRRPLRSKSTNNAREPWNAAPLRVPSLLCFRCLLCLRHLRSSVPFVVFLVVFHTAGLSLIYLSIVTPTELWLGRHCPCDRGRAQRRSSLPSSFDARAQGSAALVAPFIPDAFLNSYKRISARSPTHPSTKIAPSRPVFRPLGCCCCCCCC